MYYSKCRKRNNLPCTEVKAYNLEDELELEAFLKSDLRELDVHFSKKKIMNESQKKEWIGVSKLGTDRAVFTDAYFIVVQELGLKKVLKTFVIK